MYDNLYLTLSDIIEIFSQKKIFILSVSGNRLCVASITLSKKSERGIALQLYKLV